MVTGLSARAPSRLRSCRQKRKGVFFLTSILGCRLTRLALYSTLLQGPEARGARTVLETVATFLIWEFFTNNHKWGQDTCIVALLHQHRGLKGLRNAKTLSSILESSLAFLHLQIACLAILEQSLTWCSVKRRKGVSGYCRGIPWIFPPLSQDHVVRFSTLTFPYSLCIFLVYLVAFFFRILKNRQAGGYKS